MVVARLQRWVLRQAESGAWSSDRRNPSTALLGYMKFLYFVLVATMLDDELHERRLRARLRGR